MDDFLSTHKFASRSLGIKPALNLFVGEKNNKEYKQFLSDGKNKGKTLKELFSEAIKVFDEAVIAKRKYDKV